MRLLLIEDSLSLRQSIALALSRGGWVVDGIGCGRDGCSMAMRDSYDAIVLDVMLPNLDGWQVLEHLRGAGRTVPVLMLTARDSVDDRVRGLSAGADDYLVKPFAIRELEARLQSLVRRCQGPACPQVDLGPLHVDLGRRQATVNGSTLRLPRREYQLLELLVLHRGEIIDRERITSRLWPDEADVSPNAVEAAVSALRRSLESAGCPPLLTTRRGLGYVLDAPA